jgi:hypothetical protein
MQWTFKFWLLYLIVWGTNLKWSLPFFDNKCTLWFILTSMVIFCQCPSWLSFVQDSPGFCPLQDSDWALYSYSKPSRDNLIYSQDFIILYKQMNLILITQSVTWISTSLCTKAITIFLFSQGRKLRVMFHCLSFSPSSSN